VSARHLEHVEGRKLRLLTAVHPDAEPAGQQQLQVMDLARRRAGKRLHVDRPAPAGLELRPTDRQRADTGEVAHATGEAADDVRVGEALAANLVHCLTMRSSAEPVKPARAASR
jgi:hypothetical protein